MDDKIQIRDILQAIYNIKVDVRCAGLDEDIEEAKIDILDEMEDLCYNYLDTVDDTIRL